MTPDKAMMADNVAHIRDSIARAAQAAGRAPEAVLLCAVCKGQSDEAVRLSAALDIDCLGENRAQEMLGHHAAGAYLDRPCHFIGHLQTNKVRQVVGRAALIQSVDSLRLLQAIDREAGRQGLTQEILIQLNIGDEDSKTGAPVADLWPLLEAALQSDNLRLRGLMAIPPLALDPEQSRPYFARMRALYEDVKAKGAGGPAFDTLSMGMTDSYEVAIQEGASLVRVGRGIFGERG